MWSSIANLKENLNKIALDVHDDDDEDDELSIHAYDSPYSDRRRSHSLAHSKSASNSPITSNGNDSPYVSEIERYKSEIKKLRDSEAEIKALSVNYAALLKEKEDHIARLNQENGSLKQNLEVTNAALSTTRNEASRTSTSSLNVPKGTGEQSPTRQNKHGTLARNRSSGNQWQNGVVTKQDGNSNGFLHTNRAESTSKYPNSVRDKELADMLEEKNRLLAALQNDHELQMKKLRMEMETEREALANIKIKLQDEVKTSGSLAEELKALKSGQNETSFEVNKLCREVDDKESEIKRLQLELHKRENGANYTDSLRQIVASLEMENVELKAEKEKLESVLKETSGAGKQQSGSLNQTGNASASFRGRVELEHSLQQIEKELKDTRRERDKAKQELARLKQHLLDKELEESEKMDEDSKIIEDLRQHVEYQKATISNLERALGQARASQEEIKMMNDHELQKSKEIIEDLKKKLASFMSAIDAKNKELLNLQTALGQYYAEIEAKEHLEGDLSLSREECSKLSQLLQDSQQQVEASNKEKEEILAKLAQADKMVAEWKNRVTKLEEDNAKLRRALEQSMTRLNRMSVDSDFLVDRRIVIKLLVTYFQRNHSKEVLDLMVRMLGFSEEDKQRIGAAQQGTGKGVVRGVLGLPGRFVGGIMGGGSAGTPASTASEIQSFADLWVDYLLKESEEREKRESEGSNEGSKGDVNASSPSTPTAPSALPDRRASSSGRPPIFTPANPSIDTSRSLHSYPSSRPYDNPASEFSTVPLTPSGKQFS